jgi:predicted DsbA family dithiol-disulfide isomerase
VNTRDSHRLVDWSKQFGKQNQLIEVLFKAYFEDAKDISKHGLCDLPSSRKSLSNLQFLDILIEAAKAAGLDESAV